jgi:hypothetical protein
MHGIMVLKGTTNPFKEFHVTTKFFNRKTKEVERICLEYDISNIE